MSNVKCMKGSPGNVYECDDMQAELADLQDRFDALQSQLAIAKKQLLDYEQTEASVCPEDVGIKEYVASLKEQLATAKEALRWIPVGERLPTVEKRYLILIEGRYCTTCRFTLNRKSAGFCVMPYCNVTHYLDIPTLPEKDEVKNDRERT